MKGWTLFFGFLCVVLVSCEVLPSAEECDVEECELPRCRCSSTEIPGDLLTRNTPQFVILSFNDAINIRSIDTYRRLLYDRRNSNGCPAGATFFINHEYNNYQFVNELYNRGFEIGLHSITRRTPQTAWATASYDVLEEEIVDQRTQMAHFANIPYDNIKGVRLPFLQMTGNTSFQVMADHNLKYDYSWPTAAYVNPGIWPYTLDYKSTQDCLIPPCPTASIPGPWVLPIVTWTDLNGLPCSSVDACFNVPDLEDEDSWYRFILSNFERHYLGNRAPFSFFIGEGYISSYPAVGQAVTRFLNLINNLNDAFLVTAEEVIEWVEDPTPVNEYVQKSCRTWTETVCPAASCGPLTAEHNNFDYWIQICNVCPAVYPWVGNPLGQAAEEETTITPQ